MTQDGLGEVFTLPDVVVRLPGNGSIPALGLPPFELVQGGESIGEVEVATEGLTFNFFQRVGSPAQTVFFGEEIGGSSSSLEADVQYPVPGEKRLIRTRALVVSNSLPAGKSVPINYRRSGTDVGPVPLFIIDSTVAPGTVLSSDAVISYPNSSLLALKAQLPLNDTGANFGAMLRWVWEMVPA